MRYLILLTLAACVTFAHPATADEAEDRRDRSVATLTAQGVPVLPSLPLIETTATAQLRSQDAVVDRAIALLIVAIEGGEVDHTLGKQLTADFGASGFFSPAEAAFMANPNPVEGDNFNASWRYEGVHVMLWALGLTDELQPMDRIVEVSPMADMMIDLGAHGIRAKARLRPVSELLDVADMIYRANWAAVDARINGRPDPDGLDGEIIYERHYALNWLIGYGNQDWDDVSPDT